MSVQLIFSEKGNYSNIDELTKNSQIQCIGYATVLKKRPVRHFAYDIYNPAFK